jgi:hypothetical protein
MDVSNKVKASAKVAPPNAAAKPVAPRQQTSMTPASSKSLGGRVRAISQVARPAPEVQGHAIPPIGKTVLEKRGMVQSPDGGYASEAVRSDFGNLTPELAAGIRKAADAK